MFRFNFYWMYGIIFLLLIALYMGNDAASSKELGWTEFQKLAAENTFEQMTVFNKRNVVEATVRSNKIEEVFGSNYDYKKMGNSPKIYVTIPSADKFSDFYDKAVSTHQISTKVR